MSVVRAVLVLSLWVALPTEGSAQLGGLGKKLKQAAGLEPAFTPKEAPAFNDRILEITPERLDQLLAGMEAEVANVKSAQAEYQRLRAEAEQAEKKYEVEAKAYEKQRATYDACRSRFLDEERKKAQADEAMLEEALKGMDDEAWEKYVQDLAVRGERIAKKVLAGASDPATTREHEQFVKETAAMEKEQKRRAQMAMAGIESANRRAQTENPRLKAACGDQPTAPVRPTDVMTGPEAVLLIKGSETATLTGKDNSAEMKRQRYVMMRERVLYFVAENQRPSGMGFSQPEFDLLKSRSKELDDLAKRMRKAGVSL